MDRRSALALGLFVLAALLAANSILGPFLAGVIEYHYSETINNQGIGLDAVALILVAPVAVAAGVLVLRGPTAGPLLAFAPATFAAYMMPQYVIGPQYLDLPGNNENFFALHLATFIVAGAVFLGAWNSAGADAPQPSGRRRPVATWFLLLFPAFLVFGLYLPGFADALASEPDRREYLDNPTAFWIVAFLDLAIAAPLGVAAGVGLVRRSAWSGKALYAVVGWFALVPLSVAAMAITMVAKDDPSGSTGKAAAFVVFAVVFTAFAAWLWWPLVGNSAKAEIVVD